MKRKFLKSKRQPLFHVLWNSEHQHYNDITNFTFVLRKTLKISNQIFCKEIIYLKHLTFSNYKPSYNYQPYLLNKHIHLGAHNGNRQHRNRINHYLSIGIVNVHDWVESPYPCYKYFKKRKQHNHLETKYQQFFDFDRSSSNYPDYACSYRRHS